ncbi:hypothetical protein KIPB_000558 [Kipferlia bialata]|uniref:Uncharacterized protein n=1 Tax=Kipferlia bialata TaxID=797122 RepID=A0A9K3CP96_9EUKA|nr:hypothetical protein KIPB_000558 [Kipferlia bialata]|eukprot:g558.t1
MFGCLQELNLSNNNISRLPASFLTTCFPFLVILNLADNQLCRLEDVQDLGVLSELEVLDISGNPLHRASSRTGMLDSLVIANERVTRVALGKHGRVVKEHPFRQEFYKARGLEQRAKGKAKKVKRDRDRQATAAGPHTLPSSPFLAHGEVPVYDEDAVPSSHLIGSRVHVNRAPERPTTPLPSLTHAVAASPLVVSGAMQSRKNGGCVLSTFLQQHGLVERPDAKAGSKTEDSLGGTGADRDRDPPSSAPTQHDTIKHRHIVSSLMPGRLVYFGVRPGVDSPSAVVQTVTKRLDSEQYYFDCGPVANRRPSGAFVSLKVLNGQALTLDELDLTMQRVRAADDELGLLSYFDAMGRKVTTELEGDGEQTEAAPDNSRQTGSFSNALRSVQIQRRKRQMQAEEEYRMRARLKELVRTGRLSGSDGEDGEEGEGSGEEEGDGERRNERETRSRKGRRERESKTPKRSGPQDSRGDEGRRLRPVASIVDLASGVSSSDGESGYDSDSGQSASESDTSSDTSDGRDFSESGSDSGDDLYRPEASRSVGPGSIGRASSHYRRGVSGGTSLAGRALEGTDEGPKSRHLLLDLALRTPSQGVAHKDYSPTVSLTKADTLASQAAQIKTQPTVGTEVAALEVLAARRVAASKMRARFQDRASMRLRSAVVSPAVRRAGDHNVLDDDPVLNDRGTDGTRLLGASAEPTNVVLGQIGTLKAAQDVLTPGVGGTGRERERGSEDGAGMLAGTSSHQQKRHHLSKGQGRERPASSMARTSGHSQRQRGAETPSSGRPRHARPASSMSASGGGSRRDSERQRPRSQIGSGQSRRGPGMGLSRTPTRDDSAAYRRRPGVERGASGSQASGSGLTAVSTPYHMHTPATVGSLTRRAASCVSPTPVNSGARMRWQPLSTNGKGPVRLSTSGRLRVSQTPHERDRESMALASRAAEADDYLEGEGAEGESQGGSEGWDSDRSSGEDDIWGELEDSTRTPGAYRARTEYTPTILPQARPEAAPLPLETGTISYEHFIGMDGRQRQFIDGLGPKIASKLKPRFVDFMGQEHSRQRTANSDLIQRLSAAIPPSVIRHGNVSESVLADVHDTAARQVHDKRRLRSNRGLPRVDINAIDRRLARSEYQQRITQLEQGHSIKTSNPRLLQSLLASNDRKLVERARKQGYSEHRTRLDDIKARRNVATYLEPRLPSALVCYLSETRRAERLKERHDQRIRQERARSGRSHEVRAPLSASDAPDQPDQTGTEAQDAQDGQGTGHGQERGLRAKGRGKRRIMPIETVEEAAAAVQHMKMPVQDLIVESAHIMAHVKENLDALAKSADDFIQGELDYEAKRGDSLYLTQQFMASTSRTVPLDVDDINDTEDRGAEGD